MQCRVLPQVQTWAAEDTAGIGLGLGTEFNHKFSVTPLKTRDLFVLTPEVAQFLEKKLFLVFSQEVVCLAGDRSAVFAFVCSVLK